MITRPGEALVIYLRPRFDRQFRDLNCGGVNDGHLSTVHILVVHHLLNGSFKSFVAWKLCHKEGKNNIIETERDDIATQGEPGPVLTIGRGSSPFSMRWMLLTISRMS